jgi:hypothetical protein
MGIPELEKAGKAVQLRRAVEYMAEMGERLGGVDKELEDLRREKQDLEVCHPFPRHRHSVYLHSEPSQVI